MGEIAGVSGVVVDEAGAGGKPLATASQSRRHKSDEAHHAWICTGQSFHSTERKSLQFI